MPGKCPKGGGGGGMARPGNYGVFTRYMTCRTPGQLQDNFITTFFISLNKNSRKAEKAETLASDCQQFNKWAKFLFDKLTGHTGNQQATFLLALIAVKPHLHYKKFNISSSKQYSVFNNNKKNNSRQKCV